MKILLVPAGASLLWLVGVANMGWFNVSVSVAMPSICTWDVGVGVNIMLLIG